MRKKKQKMTEFVAPYSKQHLFIVLHEYNSKPEPIICEARVIRDSAFFPASTNTYVAAMSFRVSMFGNAHSGFVYQYIPPTYVIAADLDKESYNAEYLDTSMVATEFDLSPEADENFITMVPTALPVDQSTADAISVSDISLFIEGSASYINRYMMTDGSVIRVPYSSDETSKKYASVSLLTNPSRMLNGPGYGRKGLGTMKGRIILNDDDFEHGGGWNDVKPEWDGYAAIKQVLGHDEVHGSTKEVEAFQFRYEVDRKTLPSSWSIFDFAEYLSSGVHLTVDKESRGSVIDVLGPFMVDSLHDSEQGDILHWTDWQGEPEGDPNNAQRRLPNVRLVAKKGDYFRSGEFQYFERNSETGRYEGLPKWATMNFDRTPSEHEETGPFIEKNGMFVAYLCGRISKHYDDSGQLIDMASRYWSNSQDSVLAPADRFNFFKDGDPNEDVFYALTSMDPVYTKFKFNKVPVKAMQGYEQQIQNGAAVGDPVEIDFDANWKKNDWDHPDQQDTIQFVSDTTHRHRMQGRTNKSSVQGIYTVNELFEIFNAPEVNDGYWQLQTASNGGFEIRILKDIARFHITKAFADQLGLSDELLESVVDKPVDPQFHRDITDPELQTNYILVRVGHDPQGKEIDSLEVAEGDYDELVKEDTLDGYWFADFENPEDNPNGAGGGQEIKPGQAFNSYLKAQFVVHESDPNTIYKVIGKKNRTFANTKYFQRSLKATVRMHDGIEMYEWEDPPIGVIKNTATVSIESFSLFEGIQITIPDVPFQSQVTSWSNGERTLLELRLPVPYNTANEPSGRVAGTSFPYIADLLWSSTGGFEWLPVSSIGDLYQVTARCSLVYRDANNRAPRPLYIPQGGIFQLKMAFLEVK